MARKVDSYSETFAAARSKDKGIEALERVFLAALAEGVEGEGGCSPTRSRGPHPRSSRRCARS